MGMGFFTERIRQKLGNQKVFLRGETESEDFTNEVNFLVEAVESQEEMIKRLEERIFDLEGDLENLEEQNEALTDIIGEYEQASEANE
jgi:prefoldin subunit 5